MIDWCATYLPPKSLTNLLLTHHMLLIDIVDVAYCKVEVEPGAPELIFFREALSLFLSLSFLKVK